MFEIFGILSTLAFATCAMPQVVECWKNKHAHGVSIWFLILWFLGELFGMIYMIEVKNIIIFVNYIINMICTIIIAYYKVWPKDGK